MNDNVQFSTDTVRLYESQVVPNSEAISKKSILFLCTKYHSCKKLVTVDIFLVLTSAKVHMRFVE